MKIIKFGADWCGPCKMLAPLLEQVKQEHPEVEIENVDVDKEPNKSSEHHVRGLPTMVFIKDGREVKRIVGMTTMQSIKETLK